MSTLANSHLSFWVSVVGGRLTIDNLGQHRPYLSLHLWGCTAICNALLVASVGCSIWFYSWFLLFLFGLCSFGSIYYIICHCYLVFGHETQPYSGSSIDELWCCCWMVVSHGQILCLFMICDVNLLLRHCWLYLWTVGYVSFDWC